MLVSPKVKDDLKEVFPFGEEKPYMIGYGGH